MVHSRLDADQPTSSDSTSTYRLDPEHRNPYYRPTPTETVVAQQLSNMEIDMRTPLPSGASLLRHRLFPRAMAWDVHQATQHTDARYDDDRAYGDDGYSQGYARPLKAAKLHAHGSPLSALAAPTVSESVDGRERLFRTIGKYLDQRPTEAGEYTRRPSPPYPTYPEYDRLPAYGRPAAPYDAPVPRAGIYDMVKLHHAGHHSPTSTYTASSSHSLAHTSPTHSHSSEGSQTKKRQRGPSGSTVPPPAAGAVARPGMSTSSAKRCSVQDCGKIAVSKGLCRGHGGGRRCTFAGCTKCAQSRSPFCWAHGGGKRCEAPNCRRSRKTKRFCVDHVDMENTVPLSNDSDSDHRRSEKTAYSSTGVAEPHNVAALHLPSLTDALKRAVPAAVARASQTVTLPQSRDRLWPVAPSAFQ